MKFKCGDSDLRALAKGSGWGRNCVDIINILQPLSVAVNAKEARTTSARQQPGAKCCAYAMCASRKLKRRYYSKLNNIWGVCVGVSMTAHTRTHSHTFVCMCAISYAFVWLALKCAQIRQTLPTLFPFI